MDNQAWGEWLAREYQVWGRAPEEALEHPLAASPEGLKAAVEELSAGENTVLFDEAGAPSVMVRVPTLYADELLGPAAGRQPHPAFVTAKGVLPEIWVGKYLTSCWRGHAVSLPLCPPERYASFAQAAQACQRKGRGWGLMPFQLRMALGLASRRQGTLPHGNNHSGCDFFCPAHRGLPASEGTTLTGSGPADWSHNGKPSGIWDMKGNLNERDAALRLVDGEIQVQTAADMYQEGRFSSRGGWRALDAQGRLTAPGAKGTLRYSVCGGGILLGCESGGTGVGNCAFQRVRAAPNLASDVLRLWGLLPPQPQGDDPLGWRWICTQGERLPLCGGAYLAVDHAGIFFAGLRKTGDEPYRLAGMRLIYIDPNQLKGG